MNGQWSSQPRRRCATCGGREVFPHEGRRGPHSAGAADYAASGELGTRGQCLACEVDAAAGPGQLPEHSRVRRRMPQGGRIASRLDRGPGAQGGFMIRHRHGTYLVRYPGTAPSELAGRLGESWSPRRARIPVIVQDDGLVLVLDPRAIVMLDGRRMYGPRSLPRRERPPGLRAWLARHRSWDTARP